MLSQQELADRAGVSLFTVQRIERGEGSVRPRTGRAIASALGVGVEDLLPKAQAPLFQELPESAAEEGRRTEGLEIPVLEWASTVADVWPEAPELLLENLGHDYLNRSVPELVSEARAMEVPAILVLIEDLDAEDRWLRKHLFRTRRKERQTREGRRAYRQRLRQFSHVFTARVLAAADVAEEKAIDLPPDEQQQAVEGIQRGVDRILEGADARV